MKFPYLKFNANPCPAFPERNSCYRPIIPVHLCSIDLSKRVQYYTLLDTGADFNLFHSDLAEIVGINDFRKGNMQVIFGIEGEGIKTYFQDIIIEIGGWKFRAYSGFTDFDGKKGKDKMPYGILGQKGFFDLFKVIFDYSKLEIELKPQDQNKLFV